MSDNNSNENESGVTEERIPKYHKLPPGYTRRGTSRGRGSRGRGRGRGAAHVTATRNRRGSRSGSNSNSNTNLIGLKLLKNKPKGKPRPHPGPPRGPYPLNEERIFSTYILPKPNHKRNGPKMFLEFLKEQREGRDTKIPEKQLRIMKFGDDGKTSYLGLERMTEDEGMIWIQSQQPEYVDSFFDAFGLGP